VARHGAGEAQADVRFGRFSLCFDEKYDIPEFFVAKSMKKIGLKKIPIFDVIMAIKRHY
jgi:hypothetical protein